MNDNENNKSVEALPDEALDQVSGGGEGVVQQGALSDKMRYWKFIAQFVRNSNCDNCRLYGGCAILDMDNEEVYAMFGGNPNAKCPNFKSV